MSQAPINSETTNETPIPKKRKWRFGLGGCALLCVGVLFALICVAIAGYFIWVSASKRAVEEQFAAIRAKGEPASTADLDLWYALPPGTNDTTQLWVQACAPLETNGFSERTLNLPIVGISEDEIPPPGVDWAQLEDVEALLKEYDASMTLMHLAAEKGGRARFDRDFDAGIGMLMPNVQRLRTGSRMLQLEAHTRAHRGNLDGTIQTLRALFAVGHAVENDPTLVGQLIHIAIDGIAIGTTIELVADADFSDEQLAELQSLLRQCEYKQSMKTGMIGERAMAPQMFSFVDIDDAGAAAMLGPRHEDLAMYLDLITQVTDGLDHSWPVALDTAEQVELETEEIIESPLGRVRFFLTTMMLPADVTVISAGARGEATRSTADILVAARRFQMANGVFPKKVAELVPKYLPAVPTDPFDGKPLRYEIRGGHPVVWSIGNNRIDDHGTTDDFVDFVMELKPKAVQQREE